MKMNLSKEKNQNNPKITVGIPVFNGEKSIRRALDSVLSQTFLDFELVISDNASTDSTPLICQEYKRNDKRINLNLIITCARSLESETKNEISKILDELGDQEPEILNVGMRGILMANTIIEPSKIIDYVKNKMIEEPWLIRYCLRIIPIQMITETEIDKIKQNVIKLKDTIQKNDSYRITIEKRNTDISSTEIITEIAKIFPNKVSLNQPDWIVLIEILGNDTGISILKDDELFSLDKAKRMSD